ncbi:MAG: electron transport complex subunit RsxC [Arsenophonus sp.]|nr:MAG: electron transport complex subunit RsxC [Arsenophonus sp.]
MKKYQKKVNTILVKKGDYVLQGQSLIKCKNFDTTPIHAPTSGEIIKIENLNFENYIQKNIYIKSDYKNQLYPTKNLSNYHQYSRKKILSKIQQSGIIGLGGSGYPTAKKIKNSKKTKIFIINAVECDPYVTKDHCLIHNKTKEIIKGILIFKYLLNPSKILIGINDNNKKSIFLLKKELKKYKTKIEIHIIKNCYPFGNEKQLIEILTKKQVPSNKYPNSIGILVQNINTILSTYNAIFKGRPLTHITISIYGNLIKKPGNYLVPIGTPINFLLNEVGLKKTEIQDIILDGFFMGKKINNLSIPIFKNNHSIIAFQKNKKTKKKMEELPCINCNLCSQVCPINLLPQHLYRLIQHKKHKETHQYHLLDCIECNACTYVCPSRIQLVKYYKNEKKIIKKKLKEKEFNSLTKKRFEKKQNRLLKNDIFISKEKNKSIIDDDYINKNSSNDKYKSIVSKAIKRARLKKVNIKIKTK